MKFEKNGITYTVTDKVQITAFKNSGWTPVTDEEIEFNMIFDDKQSGQKNKAKLGKTE